MIKKLFKNRFILLFDILAIIAARMITSIMLFPEMVLRERAFVYTGGIYIGLVILVHLLTGMYNIAWYYSGTSELIKFGGINILSAVGLFALNEVLDYFNIIPEPYRRVNGGIAVISVLIMLLVRLCVKEVYKTISSREGISKVDNPGSKNRVLIIGAGDAARIIVSSFSANYASPYEIVGFIDDDASKQGKVLYGYKVLGGRENIVFVCENHDVDSIIMAIPSAYVKDRLESRVDGTLILESEIGVGTKAIVYIPKKELK